MQPVCRRCARPPGELIVAAVRSTDDKGRLLRDALDTTDVFLVDCGTVVHVWVGHGTTALEKKLAMNVRYTPSYTVIHRHTSSYTEKKLAMNVR